jgi:DNA helicase-2/ATP-dependent DNA helicase PcrA
VNEFNFTEEQKRAIFSPDGEFVVKAGAGTGKTRVLVNKYAQIYDKKCSEGVSPAVVAGSILTVTFTKRAAKEMLNRLSKHIPENVAKNTHISTIDAFCAKILKENAFAIGLDPDFRVLDEIESRLYFRNIGMRVIEEEVDWPIDLEMTLDRFLNESYKLINLLKQQLISPDEFYRTKKNNEEIQKIVYMLYKRYEEALVDDNLFDFGKLLVTAYKIIETNERLRKTLQEKYEYVLVDEYQDTNSAQIKLLRLIASPQNNYFVVGDEKQSIYAFRGAEPGHIVDMYDTIEDERKVFLSCNFRSPEPLPALINEVFKDKIKNYQPITSGINGKAEIGLFLGENRQSEAEYVAHKVKGFLDAGYKHSEIVLLFRGVKGSREYEEALKKVGIDTMTIGGAGFYQQPEIKDILAMLHVIDNPHSERELVRVLRSPAFRIKDSELAELAQAKCKGETLYTAVINSQEENIRAVKEFIDTFRDNMPRQSLGLLISDLIEKSGYIYWAVSKTGGRNSRQMANLKKFIQLARRYEAKNIFSTLSDFTQYLRLLEEVEITEAEARPKASGVVNLMSIHQSKGLEYPVVIVPNMSPQNFPGGKKMAKFHFSGEHGMVLRDDDKTSDYNMHLKDILYSNHNWEERRLLYVAMTRSMKHLIISGYKNSRGSVSKFMEYFLDKAEGEFTLKKNLKKHMTFEDSFEKKKTQLNSVIADYKIEREKVEFISAAKELGLPVFYKTKDIQKEFSVTQLETYNRCPQLYKFRYILNIPEPPADNMYSPALFGTAVHRALEEYYKLDNLNSKDKLKEKIIQVITSSGINDEEYNTYYRTSVEQVVENIFASDVLKNKNEIILTEQPFVLKINGCYVKGTIDRVDKSLDGAELLDYKTSMKDDVSPYVLQMALYNKALEKIFNLNVKKTNIVFLKKNSIKEVPSLKHLELRIKSILNGIRNKKFYKKKDACAYCNYKLICNG